MHCLTDKVVILSIRFHGLQHSQVSYLLHNDIVYFSKRVGHSNVGMTLKIYSHMLKEKEESQSNLTKKLLQKTAIHKLR